MPRSTLRILVIAGAVMLAARPAAASSHEGHTHATSAAADAATGIQKEMIASLDDAGKKLIELAEAMPADKFKWAPGKEARSAGQVIAHVIGGNYFIPTFLGLAIPAEMPKDLEKNLPEKAKLIEMLKASHAYARNAIAGVSDADLATPVKIFGMDATRATACMILVSHSHEHLGQSIAYARSNGIAPPWTARQQEAAAKAGESK
jgi:uncharacterized damage-inducible protein DinB